MSLANPASMRVATTWLVQELHLDQTSDFLGVHARARALWYASGALLPPCPSSSSPNFLMFFNDRPQGDLWGPEASCGAWQEFFFLGRDCWGRTRRRRGTMKQKRHIAALTHVARMERVCPLLITGGEGDPPPSSSLTFLNCDLPILLHARD